MKNYKGKAIYQPSGKAGEYARWACNFYVGCSNGCTYCYCKKGLLASAMGQKMPQLKKGLGSEKQAEVIVRREIDKNQDELKKHGLFLSFTTDPLLPETRALTFETILACAPDNIPVTLLTKRADFIEDLETLFYGQDNRNVAIGFTLTGHDELEPGASSNQDRIEAMKSVKQMGFKTWTSIEPIIDIDSSVDMIRQVREFCDLFKVGLESGRKYDRLGLQSMMMFCYSLQNNKFYFKDTFLKKADIQRCNLPGNCVDRDFNLFISQKRRLRNERYPI